MSFLKIIKKYLLVLAVSKNFFFSFFAISFFLCGFSAQSFASQIDDSEVIKEIEKTILFDKESSQQINFYKPKKEQKKSSLVINHRNPDEFIAATPIEIKVSNQNVSNLENREKEKLAYNATLSNQFEVAVELYKQVLLQEPENNYAKFSLAVIYQKLKQYRQAKSLYYELLKSDATNKEEIVGNILSVMIEDSPKDALYLLTRLVSENPESPIILAQAALAYDKISDYQRAISLLKRAVLLQPDRIDYEYNLAVIYDKISDFDNALIYYNEVMKKADFTNSSFSIEQVQERVNYLRK
jgi:tetratricopeptide (TPR) repeat protein